MEIEQTTELTYIKVDDMDKKINEILDMVTDSNPEASTTLKELTNEIKTDTESIKTKVNSNSDKLDTIIENQSQGASVDLTSIETSLSNITTSLSKIQLHKQTKKLLQEYVRIIVHLSDVYSSLSFSTFRVKNNKHKLFRSSLNIIKLNLLTAVGFAIVVF